MKDFEEEEKIRKEKRELRRAELRRLQIKKQRQKQILVFGCAGICLAVLLITGIWLAAGKLKVKEEQKEPAVSREDISSGQEEAERAEEPGKELSEEISGEETAQDESAVEESTGEESTVEEATLPFAGGYTAETTEATAAVDSESVLSTYAVLINLDDGTVTAQRNIHDRISPASMTKILTVLVAAEHITDLDDTFTITREITDYSYSNDCSAAGFDDGETVTVKDLMYGTILPSGADAAAGLACYVSGSLESFVELMNEKIAELGLSDSSHFTNCVGLYDENHYSTVYDMAIMLKAAVENELCREVLSAHIYTTSPTEQHPEGIELSNWFLRRIEDKETNGEVVCAKTGFVAQSGSCAASYEVSDSGKHYICVTADTYSSWRCIYDHVAVYQKYTE